MPDSTDTAAHGTFDSAPASSESASSGSMTGAPGMIHESDMPVLKEHYEIRPDHPLTELNSATASAFAAFDRRDPSTPLVGYISQSGHPPRWDIIGSLPGLESANMVRLMAYGTVRWPLDRKEHPAIVFERPRGKRVLKSVKQRRSAFHEDQLVRIVMEPLVQALAELKARRVTHGSINPTNMFLRETDGNNAKVQLGECITGPVGFRQPIAYETVERGMAEPCARGPTISPEDLYALGVTILFFSIGYLPGGQLDDRVLLDEKSEKGSYIALVGDQRVPLGVLEPIRGLLVDNIALRWSLEDLEQWMTGRRLSPRQAHAPQRGARPFPLGGHDYWTTRTLAAAIGQRPLEGNSVIEKGELVNWIRRNLDADDVVNRVEEAIRSARVGRGGSTEDRRVARVAIALDPPAPIRFRGRRVMPSGIGDALGDACIRGGSVQELAEIITAQLPMFWINTQEDFGNDLVPLTSAMDRARGFLDQRDIGNGIERCLYELNHSVPCQSPLLRGAWTLDVESMLHSFEEIAATEDRPAEPMDRHIAAFVLSRQPKLSDKVFYALSNEEHTSERQLALLALYLELQKITRIEKLPNLCSWIGSLMEPVIATYHSRTLRERIREAVESEAKSGQLKNLHAIFSNANLVRRDAAAFSAACRDHGIAGRCIASRQNELADRSTVAQDAGRQTAAVISGLLSAAMMVIIVVLNAG